MTEKSEPYQLRDILCACFCPGIILGTMDAQVMRETKELCTITWGRSCCWTCFKTTIMCSIGWPISPILACYLCIQRRNLQRIYGDTLSWSYKDHGYGLFWHLLLLDHKRLFEEKYKMGILHYDWSNNIEFTERIENDIKNKRLFIIGPRNSGKSTLRKKICGIIDTNNKYCSHDTLQVDVTGISFSANGSFTLEVWDIPEHQIDQSFMNVPDYVIIAYDSTNIESLSSAKLIYEHISFEKKIHSIWILVATKIDYWENPPDSQLSNSNWKIECMDLAIQADGWAKQQNMHHILVSNPMNEGILRIMKLIKS